MGDAWLNGLLDDTTFAGRERTLPPGQPDWAGTGHAALIGSLVIRDDRLAAVDRALRNVDPIPCRVINTGGAGGLLPLADRTFEHLRPTSVRTGLRDLDDLAGATARVAVAARELDSELTVLIELPDAPGWQRAVDTAELEMLSAAITDHAGVAEQLGVLIEADVPFVITGPVTSADRVTELIMTVLALIDGTEPETGPPTPEQGARIRRRLLGIEVESVSELIMDLASRGWLGDD